jgi:hypothetical protein
MGNLKFGATACTAILAIAATPSAAEPLCWNAKTIEAAKLRQLDVMLLVGSLRCRKGPSDYRAAYDGFLLQHRAMLGRANLEILSEMRGALGAAGAADALDRASVRMANHYGETSAVGCAELGQVAAALARSSAEALPRAAQVLIGKDAVLASCGVQVAVAGR